MVGTQIEVRLHENYVHTRVRFCADDALSYVEYGLYGASAPLQLFNCEAQDDLRGVAINYVQDEERGNRPYLPEFNGYVSLVILIEKGAPVSDFEVESARYVDAKKGGRDVVGALRDPQFKNRILANIFQKVEDRDVPGLVKVLNALDVAGA